MRDETRQRTIGTPVRVNIKISARMHSQQVGEHFRSFAILTAECNGHDTEWMMLPGPYDGPGNCDEFRDVALRWRAQVEWIRKNFTDSALSLAHSLVNKAWLEDEGLDVGRTRQKLKYTKRQAQRFRELLPKRKNFWKQSRRNGLNREDAIWPLLIEAFDARAPRKGPPRGLIKPKYKTGQIALIHAALDAGIRLRNHELLGMPQWRTVQRELVLPRGDR